MESVRLEGECVCVCGGGGGGWRSVTMTSLNDNCLARESDITNFIFASVNIHPGFFNIYNEKGCMKLILIQW